MEMMVPYACHESETDEDSADGISGAVRLKAPNPLLANWGVVNDLLYLADIAVRFFLFDILLKQLILSWQMMTLFNAQERTIRQFDQLFESAGWKITTVRRQPGVDVTLNTSIVAVPIWLADLRFRIRNQKDKLSSFLK
jgi:hypothetical protein